MFAALSAVRSVVETRNTIPILGNVKLELGGNGLHLTATDLDVEITTSLPIPDMFAKGDTTIGAAMLHDVVKKLSGDSVAFQLSEDGTTMKVSAGRSNFTLQVLPSSDFPAMQTGTISHQFELPARALRRALQKVQFAISTEETRYYLNGVYVHTPIIEGRRWLRFVATDGHRLARYQIPAPAGAEDMPGVIVPRKTAGLLMKLVDEKNEGNVQIEVSERLIRFAIGTVTLVSKLIDGTFPDYHRVIPVNNSICAVVKRAELAQAADRVSTIALERGRAIKLDFAPGHVDLAMNHDAGNSAESVDIDYNDPALSIGFNSRYLLDILGVLDQELVSIRLADPGSPTIFVGPDDEAHMVVLMPMRV